MIGFEFNIIGTPISLRTNDRDMLELWKTRIRQAAADRWPKGAVAIEESVQAIVTYYYIPKPAEDDNFVKPILEALNLLVYVDAKQITRLTVRQQNINNLLKVRQMPIILAQGSAYGEEFIHVKINVAPRRKSS